MKEKKAGSGLRSMTGYAACVAQQDGVTIRASLRSVNHRFLDLRLHLPEMLLPLEGKLRSAIQARHPRGHLELKVVLEQPAGRRVAVDETLLEHCVELFRRLGDRYGLRSELDLVSLAQLPGVISLGGTSAGEEMTPPLEAAVLQAVEQTLERWDAMRGEEARWLAEDLEQRLGRVGEWTGQLEQLRQQLLPEAQQRLQQRLEGLLGQSGLDLSRLAQEAALLADRTDPTEEILRLKAHVQQSSRLLAEGTEAGRKLDFLLQEIHREINTLLSKTTGLGECGLPMTRLGLDVKAEVEKIREQTQNLQ
ncbi:MAG: YicC family protein [Acidobacteria bacterium]|nr:YicC family protein [Acidobacteriota bacterium]